VDRIHTTLTITGLCALIVGWQLWQRTGDPTAQSDRDGPSLVQALQPTAAPAADGSTPPAARKTEEVFGFQVLKERNCTVGIRYIPDAETGEVHEAMSCAPLNPAEPHPYESWSSELLAQEAYADPDAAEVLGLRYIRSDDPRTEQIGLSLVYRSASLSGDPAVFNRAIGTRYAYVSQNGEPRLDNLKQQLVFRHLSRALGGQGPDLATIEQELRLNDVPEAEISRIRDGSLALLEKMADLQTEITGSTSIREALENA
jgi:hypothetical protein